MKIRHVILLTYGEPPTASFSDQLVYSWRILLGLTRSVAPIPPYLLPVIALSRGRFRNRLWRTEHYGSPLESITRAQAGWLATELRERFPGVDWRVRVAYEFRRPLLIEVLESLPAGEEALVVPMYAADSAFTHELSGRKIAAWAERSGRARSGAVEVLGPLDPEALAEASARHIERELESRGIAPGADWALVLAAHGTLLEPPRPLNTGRVETERLAAAILARIGGRFGMGIHCWLNHTFGGRWTQPPVEEALHSVVAAGFRRVVYYPFGFLADNAESELEGRIALRGQPELEAVHLPCVNVGKEFIGVLACAVGEDRPGSSGDASRSRTDPDQAQGVPSSSAASAADRQIAPDHSTTIPA